MKSIVINPNGDYKRIGQIFFDDKKRDRITFFNDGTDIYFRYPDDLPGEMKPVKDGSIEEKYLRYMRKEGSGTMYKKQNPASGDVDEIGAQELAIYIENSPELYRRQGRPIIINLARKIKRGVYDPVLAVKLWGYLADSGAQEYNFEHGDRTRSLKMFNKNTRRRTAELLQEYFEDEVRETAEELLKGKKINPCGGKKRMNKKTRRKNPLSEFKRLQPKIKYKKSLLYISSILTNDERNFLRDLEVNCSAISGIYFTGISLSKKDCEKLAKILNKIL